MIKVVVCFVVVVCLFVFLFLFSLFFFFSPKIKVIRLFFYFVSKT